MGSKSDPALVLPDNLAQRRDSSGSLGQQGFAGSRVCFGQIAGETILPRRHDAPRPPDVDTVWTIQRWKIRISDFAGTAMQKRGPTIAGKTPLGLQLGNHCLVNRSLCACPRARIFACGVALPVTGNHHKRHDA